jgi:hypothetical protein
VKVSRPCELHALLLLEEEGGVVADHECPGGRGFPLLKKYIQYPDPALKITKTTIATQIPIAVAESILYGLLSTFVVRIKEATALFVVVAIKSVVVWARSRLGEDMVVIRRKFADSRELMLILMDVVVVRTRLLLGCVMVDIGSTVANGGQTLLASLDDNLRTS